MKTALSIAGSDSCAGAGMQADIKTMLANGVYATCAVTALTAQNTTGVSAVQAATPEMLKQQIDAVFADIVPDAVKIGMLANEALIHVTAERLTHYGAKNVVVDPVMVATSGDALLQKEAGDILAKALFPLATVVTPNLPEAQALTGQTVETRDDMVRAGKALQSAYGCAVLIKGGHGTGSADDVLVEGDMVRWFTHVRIPGPGAHGTGCTLSSAIAANLAKGFSLSLAIERAKAYLTGALAVNLDLGHGSPLLDHGYDLRSPFIHA